MSKKKRDRVKETGMRTSRCSRRGDDPWDREYKPIKPLEPKPTTPTGAAMAVIVTIIVLVVGMLWYTNYTSKTIPTPKSTPAPVHVVVPPVVTPPAPEVNDPDNSGHHLRWERNRDGSKKYFWRDENGHKHWWPQEK